MQVRALLLIIALATPVTALAETRTATLEVSNLYCDACAIRLRRALERVEGVENAQVDLPSKRVTVTFETGKTSAAALAAAAASVGFPTRTVAPAQDRPAR